MHETESSGPMMLVDDDCTSDDSGTEIVFEGRAN